MATFYMENFESVFEQDLQAVADRVSTGLNIFNETATRNNKLVTLYGDDEFIALFMYPYVNKPELGRLRLRTRDMAATWDCVPIGFSKINESRGLLADMRRAAHVSLKRNSIWYIDKQIKDVVGDRIVLTELTTNKGYLYKVAFTNKYVTYLSITRDDREYNKPHDEAQLYLLTKKDKEPISAPMTADECILMLINIAMQTDKRIAEFISVSKQCGGKTTVPNAYRTQEESVDEVTTEFNNGYAVRFRIQNGEMLVDLLGKYDANTYLIDVKKFENVNDIYASVREITELEQFVPAE